MRGALAAGAILVALAVSAGAYLLVVRHEGRDIRGSAAVEFNPNDVPATTAAAVPTVPRPASPSTTARAGSPATTTAAGPSAAELARQRADALARRTVVWATYGFDNRRLRVGPASTLRPPFRPIWTFHGRTLLEFPPAVAYDRLYMPTFDGRFYALDPRTGATVWEFSSGRCSWASPAVSDGLVFETFLGHTPSCKIANSTENDGEVIAFDAQSGRIRWRARIGSTESSPLVVGTRVIVGDWSGEVVALDAQTGAVVWRYRTGGAIKGSAAAADGRVYIGSYDAHLYALDAETGRLLWRASSQPRIGSSGTFYATPSVAYGRVYIGSTDGKVYSYGAASGSLRWSFSTGGYVYSSAAVWNRLVLVGSYDNTFYALDAATGEPRWRFPANGRITGAATVLNGVVYFSTLAERSYALDAETGRLLWTWPDGKYSPLVADGERVYLVGYGRMWGMVPK